MELGGFQNQYGAAELSNKQLHIKEGRDILWQGRKGVMLFLRIQF